MLTQRERKRDQRRAAAQDFDAITDNPVVMEQPRIRNVFVYGTLRRGGRNDINRLAPAPKYLGMGEVKGSLYHFDWYPGLALGGEEAVTVVGEVYEVTPQLETVLDSIEGIVDGDHSEYFKRDFEVNVAGEAVRCFLYEINPQRVADKEPIGHGDWIRFHAR
jgi:gamma-glutamylcyclotransferase (GGCT)/AIG2-like uncharacterized protein YtfP